MDLKVIKNRKIYLTITAIVMIVSILLLTFKGLNYGIDYTGGTMIQITTEAKIQPGDVQNKVMGDSRIEALNLGEHAVQLFNPGEAKSGAIIKTRLLDDAEEKIILDVFTEKIGAFSKDDLQVQKVGPAIGKELLRNALYSLVIAALLMLIYISFRFQFKSGVAAVFALLHDVLIVLGFFALTQKEIDGPFLAAILTLVGYSINDTIVIFDKIRENMRQRRNKDTFYDVVNTSINQSLRRTINTSVTTLVAILALLFFGGSSIYNFTLAITIGLVAGTYSSIFIASPIWAIWETATEGKR